MGVFTTSPVEGSSPGVSSAREWKTRVDLAAAFRLVALHGWDDLIFTHITARIPGTADEYLVNPFHLTFDEITASSLVRVSVEGKILDDRGAMLNMTNFDVHGTIHKHRPDVGCIVHTHSIAGMAIASRANGLLPLNQAALLVYGDLAYYPAPGSESAGDDRIALDLKKKNALIMRNHGLLTVGPTIPQAFTTMYYLQRACEAQVAGGPDLGLVLAPSEWASHIDEQAKSGRIVADALIWPALLRRLDRTSPDYAS
jgi:ribulose-5-phosphate 4-epimerase/fuculose-1-phosphate aldolase